MDLLHRELYDWYEHNKRVLPWRETSDPYRIWLSEIILQQTRVQQGMEYYERFVERWPDVHLLAAAHEDEVLRMWQGLGYYSRARHLHEAARMIVERWGHFPDTYDDVLALPGVGEYTAGAICSFAYDQPYPAVDGNVYRVLARLFDLDEAFDTSAGKRHFREYAWQILDQEHPRLHNSAIMEFGALYCTPTGMDCDSCPLAAVCLAHAHGTAELLPVRKERRPLRDRYLYYTIPLIHEPESGRYKTVVHQRGDGDIWAHLYEFPIHEATERLSEHPALCLPGVGLVFHYRDTHILSHQRLHAEFVGLSTDDLSPWINDGYTPVYWDELDDYALSRLTLKTIEQTPIALCN